MGGVSRIYFTAIDCYARRYRIEGCAFEIFRQLVGAMDDEYLDWENERQKAEAEKRKHNEK